MTFTDRIRRTLLDGATFSPKVLPISAPEHLFIDPDLQLRLGIGNDIGVIPNVVAPTEASVPAYDAINKIWVPLSSSQTNVVTGSFTADDWVLISGGAYKYLDIDTTAIDSQKVYATVFDTTSGSPLQTYVDVYPTSLGSVKFSIAPGAAFPGTYIISTIKAAGTSISGGSGGGSSSGGGGIQTLAATSGATQIIWSTNRCTKMTLVGNATVSMAGLSSLETDRVTLIIGQGNGGNHALNWSGASPGAPIKWANGFQPDLTQTNGAADLYEFVWDGINYTCVNCIPNIS